MGWHLDFNHATAEEPGLLRDESPLQLRVIGTALPSPFSQQGSAIKGRLVCGFSKAAEK